MKFYLIGIKGTGLSSIALILKQLGHIVRGCDTKNYIFTQENLTKNNIIIDDINDFSVTNYDVIIIGNHFFDKYAYLKNKYKVITYQECLVKIINNHHSISICGTHGKTTTSWMIANCFKNCYLTSFLVGDGHGKGTKNSKYFIFESCEYMDNFLNYYPNSIVLTNVDYDHVDYFKSKEQYNESFRKYLSHAKNFVFVSDQISTDILTKISCKILKYGTSSTCDLYAYNIIEDEFGTTFDLNYLGNVTENIHLPIYGMHIFYDALACILCALTYNINLETILKYLKDYHPANRRLNITSLNKQNIIVDDYGHHPLEISLTLKSIIQRFPNKKIITIFHPDRYSRVKTFYKDYINIFKKVDDAYIIPFLTNNTKEKELLDDFNKNNVSVLKNQLIKKNYQNTIFFFTGSKDMSKWINQIKDKYNK